MPNIFNPAKLLEATDSWLKGRWGGKPNGERFLCGLCGHKFEKGDKWRGVMANGADNTCCRGNFLVCERCHNEAGGEDKPLLERRRKLEEKAERLERLGLTPSPSDLSDY